MKAIERRLQSLEAKARPHRGVRYFTGYEASVRYYEVGSRTPNYRFGLNSEAEAGDYFTKQDIAELERQGWTCNVITICYVVDWRDGLTPEGDVLRTVNWPDDDLPLATVQPGTIDKLLPS